MQKLKLASLALALGVAMGAQANEDVIIGDTVVVTANRSAQKLLDSSSSVSVVSAEEISKRNATSIPDLVQDEPGVRLVNDGTPGLKRISLRGETPNRTLIMVDGQRIDDQKNKSGAPLLINPFFVDHIEVVRGPASVLYGSDAAGGIVNVITKQAAAEPFTFEGGVLFDSSANGFTEHATVSGTVQDFHYVFGAFNTNNDDLFLDGHEALDNTSNDSYGFNAVLSYDLTENMTVGYRGEYYSLEAETATTVTHPVYKDYLAHIPSWERYKHAVFLNVVDINDYISAIDASFYYQKNEKDFDSWPQKGLIVDVLNDQETFGANLQFEFDLNDSMSLITGYDGRYEQLSSESNVSVHMGRFTGKFFIDDADFKQYNHALYALLSSSLTDDLTLNTGIRYNYVQNKAGTTTLNQSIQFSHAPATVETKYYNYGDQVEVKTLGSVGLVYRPFKHGAFRANWSQGFRAPSIQELFLLTSTGTLQYGNPELEAETSDNFEVGFRWSDANGLNADFSIFYTASDDYIETYKKTYPQGSFFTYRNIAEAYSFGAETEISYSFNNGRFEPYLSFTAMKRKYETEQGSTSNTGTPRLSGTAGLRFNHSLFSLDTFARFASDTKNDDLAGTSYFGETEWGGYTTWNVRASSDFGTHDLITVSASIENIFDKHYQTNELIHEPGCFATVSVVARF